MPISLSPRIILLAPGETAPALPPGALALPQHASEAFGDGSHPTTRLCAAVLDQLCRTERPNSLLDVGTGTGVLARIARARGVAHVVATDIAPPALEAARANLALDRAGREVLVSNASPGHWGASFELVVANILEEVLRALAAELASALRPGGRLLLSGFTPAQVPSVRQAFLAEGLESAGESVLEGWVLLIFRKPA